MRASSLGKAIAVAALLSLLVAASASAAVMSAGNGIYKVFVVGNGLSNTGQFTAQTDTGHPVGGGKNILFGNGVPGTSYTTIHSFTSGTNYTNAAGSVGGSTDIGQFGTVTALGTTGFRTTYVLPGPATTADAMTIVQDVNVAGADFNSSHIDVTTTVTNNGATSVGIGVRYLLDWQIGVDDGPTFQAQSPDGAVLKNEASFASPAFQFFRIEDNDGNPLPPTFDVLGTAAGPPGLTPTPTPPTLLQYTSWPNSVDSPFAYTTNPSLDVADPPSDDSAGNIFWGDQAGNALVIGAGQSRTVSFSLFATVPHQPIPVDTTPPTTQATVPACSPTGQIPVKVTDNPGGSGPKAVHYRISGGAEQVVATDTNGNATITVPNGAHALEYWGEDKAGNQESPHHSVTFTVDTTHQCQAIVTGAGLAPPLLGKTANIFLKSGTVLVKLPGSDHFVPVTAGEQIPLGSTLDTTHGTVTIVTATPAGGTQSGDFQDGQFVLTQSMDGTTILSLTGGGLAPARAARAGARVEAARGDRHVWGNAHGRYTTRGRWASATVRGTHWEVADSCSGTKVVVLRGTVTVRDRVRHVTVTVHAHHHYFAAAPPAHSCVARRPARTPSFTG